MNKKVKRCFNCGREIKPGTEYPGKVCYECYKELNKNEAV